MFRQRARRGFTLIEIIVVLLILSVATVVTLPALLREPVEDEMTVALRTMDSLFRLARDSAARTNAPVTVVLDSATGTAWLLSDLEARQGAVPDGGAVLPLPAAVRLEIARSRARFRLLPTGASYADSLVLRSALTVHTLTLDPWTGHVVLLP